MFLKIYLTGCVAVFIFNLITRLKTRIENASQFMKNNYKQIGYRRNILGNYIPNEEYRFGIDLFVSLFSIIIFYPLLSRIYFVIIIIGKLIGKKVEKELPESRLERFKELNYKIKYTMLSKEEMESALNEMGLNEFDKLRKERDKIDNIEENEPEVEHEDAEFEEKHGKGKEYFDNGVLQYEGNFKNGKYDGFGKYYYSDGNLCFVGDFKNGKWFHGKRYNSAGIIYDGDFNENEEKHGKGKYIYEGVLYYDGEFQHNEIHGKGKLYDENGVLAYDGDFVESRREGNGKYYIDGKLVYDGERKDGIPLKPRDGYSKDEEDERYANDLCGRFWCQYTALQEHRKGTL